MSALSLRSLRFAAEFCGMTPAELRDALRSAATCPLCSETGDGESHSARICAAVLDVWADQAADARNSAF